MMWDRFVGPRESLKFSELRGLGGPTKMFAPSSRERRRNRVKEQDVSLELGLFFKAASVWCVFR